MCYLKIINREEKLFTHVVIIEDPEHYVFWLLGVLQFIGYKYTWKLIKNPRVKKQKNNVSIRRQVL